MGPPIQTFNHIIFPVFQRYTLEEEDDIVGPEIDVFPKQFGERFMLRLMEFRLKLQVNLGDEGLAHKFCNVSMLFKDFPFTTYPLLQSHIMSFLKQFGERFILRLNEFRLKLGRQGTGAQVVYVRIVFLQYEPRREKTGFLHMRKQRRRADQRLCFRYIDSTIPLLLIYEISSLQPSFVVEQPGLCQTWSETPKTGFLTTRLIYEKEIIVVMSNQASELPTIPVFLKMW